MSSAIRHAFSSCVFTWINPKPNWHSCMDKYFSLAKAFSARLQPSWWKKNHRSFSCSHHVFIWIIWNDSGILVIMKAAIWPTALVLMRWVAANWRADVSSGNNRSRLAEYNPPINTFSFFCQQQLSPWEPDWLQLQSLAPVLHIHSKATLHSTRRVFCID